MRISQKQATINSLISALQRRGIKFDINNNAIAEYLTKEDKQEAKRILYFYFKLEIASYKSTFQSTVNNDKRLKRYVCGLVSNWLRKAPELNCGDKNFYYIAI